MGRKFLASAAIAAATLGISAGSAMAATGPSMSNGTKLTAKKAANVASRMHEALTQAPAIGTAEVINHSKLAECTVPEGGGNYTNFFTTDTTNYVEFTGLVLVGECTADLNNKQTSATAGDKPGAKKMIAFPGTFATYSEECNITYKGEDFYGDAESIVYKSGEFVETCIVPIEID
jgi:hypothetical protein